jgi:two-component system, chemotaxis family, protein-glutamate methylesterase/glutaminase
MPRQVGNKRIRVLVVDDSVFMGMQIARILNDDDDIEVVGRARDGAEALERLQELEPDVVTLDVDMPVMDGLTALKHIMAKHPVPTVMISAQTTQGARSTFEALRFGAVDVVPKPSRLDSEDLGSHRGMLQEKVKRAASLWIGPWHQPRGSVRLSDARRVTRQPPDASTRFIGIAAGAGCHFSLLRVIPNLSPDFQDVLIVVLHESAKEVEPFVSYLAEYTAIPVKDVWDVQVIEKGACYVCSADDRVILSRDTSGEFTFDLHREPADSLPGPVDRMLCSVAELVGRRAVGVVMTGPGNDGIAGIAAIRAAGGIAAVQSMANCIDPEMPLAVLKSGAVVKVLPDFRIADFLAQGLVAQEEPASFAIPVSERPADPIVESESFSGYIEGVDIIEYVQFILLTGKSVIIEIAPTGRQRCQLFVREGTVVHATFRGLEGEQALYECLCCKGGSFANLPWREPRAITIDKPGEWVLMEAARRRDEACQAARESTG